MLTSGQIPSVWKDKGLSGEIWYRRYNRSYCPVLHDAHPSDLDKVCQSFKDFPDSVLFKGSHPLAFSDSAYFLHKGPILNQFFDLRAGNKQLVNACSSSVARIVAVVAAAPSMELQVVTVARIEFIEEIFTILLPQQVKLPLVRVIWFFAFRAESAY